MIRIGWLLFFAIISTHGFAQKKQILVRMDSTAFAASTIDGGPHLDVRTKTAKGLAERVRLYIGKRPSDAFSYKADKIVVKSPTRALIRYKHLAPVFQKAYVETLWPKDRVRGDVLEHRVIYAGHETLWTIAELFTGSGQNFRAIKQASGMRNDRIYKGMLLRIPVGLLKPVLRQGSPDMAKPDEPTFASSTPLAEEEVVVEETAPPPTVSEPGSHRSVAKPATDRAPANQSRANEKKAPETKPATEPTPKPQRTSSDLPEHVRKARSELTYGGRGDQRYAVYRLQAGEAIYSSVVVRFCGLVRAREVNQVAKDIIQFNNIRDETDLAIGTRIKIPYDLLEAEFRAEDDPDFIAYLDNLEDVSRVSTELQAANLEGVYVLLDAGHGGSDPGAKFGSVWEDDFVYDILCRVRQKLLVETSAEVHATIKDPSVGYKVQNVTRFKRDTDERLLSTPRTFSLNTRRVSTDGVNMRWMIANRHYAEFLKKGGKPENMVFASLHADSLHRSLRGAMVYVPDARKYPRSVKPPTTRFRNFQEYKKGNQFRFSQKEMLQAQARSTNFARNYIAESSRAGLRVHKQKPIRTVIYRNPRLNFVPAVLKYNRVPTRVLIEVCNLNNVHDRKLLADPKFRQRVADTFVEALYRTYGQERGGRLSSVVGNGSK